MHSERLSSKIKDYIAIARPDHWFKNVFMLPGAALGLVIGKGFIPENWLWSLILGIVATCAITSANYTINDWLDAEFDRHHPTKKHRPSAMGRMDGRLIYLQWFLLSSIGIGLSASISSQFLMVSLILLAMGIVYNVNPIRSKDRKYLDVLSESVNNPLRFMLGWFTILSHALPPSSVLIAYWLGGAYLMAIKRYAEYRFIGDPKQAGLCRRSFCYYNEESLLLSAFFYALTSAFFLGVFLIKYRVEFLIAIPFLAWLFVWYLRIGLKSDSVTQRPEKLYTEKRFVAYIAFVAVLITALFFVDLPWLQIFVNYHVLGNG
jgi:4-hydroxybenzoate polyprenyltransferase